MKDRIVATIATLTSMLVEQTENFEAGQESLSLALDGAQNLAERIENLERELRYAQDDKEALRRALDEQRYVQRSPSSYRAESLGSLADSFLRNPDAFAQCVAFLRSPDCAAMAGNKIAMIKKLRELGGYGLKGAFGVGRAGTPFALCEACATPRNSSKRIPIRSHG